jgi:predicted small lipoprotein YifL
MRHRFTSQVVRRSFATLLLAAILLAIAGCGSKGGLYLPPTDDTARQAERK